MNAGSSSLRLAAFETARGLTPRAKAHHHGAAGDPVRLLRGFAQAHGLRPAAISHRVVHGGARLTAPCVIDAAVEEEIERLSVLAPLHNPVALRWIAAAREVFPDAAQVAVFDTALYARLPRVASTYALPRELMEEHEARRYGFHGLAHAMMIRRWRELRPGPGRDAGLITLQLGAGCSITASRAGEAVDTSMGFSPLEGLVMATRAGDVDPGLLLHLQRSAGLDAAALERTLNHESGLLGLAGCADMRQLLASDEGAAREAVELYCYRARKYIGAYLAALGGAAAIAFGGGVGENAPAVRERILAGLDGLGIALEPARNDAAVGIEARVSSPASGVEVWVMPVDEAVLLAEAAASLVKGKP